VQRELSPCAALMAGYFGSKGTHLILRRNINQPVNGVLPYPVFSQSSPMLADAPLGNITQVERPGSSSYNALWVSINKRFAQSFQVNASYTWSKSLDYNSLSTEGIVVQDSYDLRNDRGLSDFDARHRFVASGIYQPPYRDNWLLENWQFAILVQAQSGNPVDIVTSNSTLTGIANTVRPDITGPIAIIGSADSWFDTSVFKPVLGFGNLDRNAVLGPGFSNTDFSVMRNIELSEGFRMEFRVEAFDLSIMQTSASQEMSLALLALALSLPPVFRPVNPVRRGRSSSPPN
jgi:hypothetical protein